MPEEGEAYSMAERIKYAVSRTPGGAGCASSTKYRAPPLAADGTAKQRSAKAIARPSPCLPGCSSTRAYPLHVCGAAVGQPSATVRHPCQEQPAGADPKWTPATAKQAGVPAALPHAVAGAPATNRTATICEAPAAHGGYRVQVLQRSKRIAIEVYDPVSKEQVLLVCNLHESGVLIYLPERLPTRFRRDGLVYYPETHPCVNSWIRFGDGSYVVCCDWANKAHIAAGQVDKFESVPPSIVRDYPAWTEWLIARLPTLCSQTTIYNALRDADLVGGFGAAGACELLTEHSIPPELPARPLLESAVFRHVMHAQMRMYCAVHQPSVLSLMDEARNSALQQRRRSFFCEGAQRVAAEGSKATNKNLYFLPQQCALKPRSEKFTSAAAMCKPCKHPDCVARGGHHTGRAGPAPAPISTVKTTTMAMHLWGGFHLERDAPDWVSITQRMFPPAAPFESIPTDERAFTPAAYSGPPLLPTPTTRAGRPINTNYDMGANSSLNATHARRVVAIVCADWRAQWAPSPAKRRRPTASTATKRRRRRRRQRAHAEGNPLRCFNPLHCLLIPNLALALAPAIRAPYHVTSSVMSLM